MTETKFNKRDSKFIEKTLYSYINIGEFLHKHSKLTFETLYDL